MHPDSLIAGLRRELERLDPKADDHEQRTEQINAEIERIDALPRPEVAPDDPATRVDHVGVYLDGLKRELERAAEERAPEILEEIERIEKLISSRGAAAAAEEQTPQTPATPPAPTVAQVEVPIGEDGIGQVTVELAPATIVEPQLVDAAGTVTVTAVKGQPEQSCINVAGATPESQVTVSYSIPVASE